MGVPAKSLAGDEIDSLREMQDALDTMTRVVDSICSRHVLGAVENGELGDAEQMLKWRGDIQEQIRDLRDELTWH